MHLGRIFAFVGISFGAVFVLVNAGGLPWPWDVAVRMAGAVLTGVAAWFGVVRGPVAAGPPAPGLPWVYWVAVAAEIAAVPAGAAALRALGWPQLVVLWVVFVVGAHFLPARVFRVGRWAELGAVLMAVATVAAGVHVALGAGWVPPAGAVTAGVVMLGFSAVPAWTGPRGRRSRA